MFKRGIVRLDQLEQAGGWIGARRLRSLLLLRDLRGPGAERAALYNGILRHLQVANGTWKDSFRGRFARLDRETLEVIAATHPAGSPLVTTDLAVASGLTSIELYNALRASYAVDFVATDLWRDALAVTGRRGTVILDARGQALQYVVGGFVLPGHARERAVFPVNHALRLWASRALLPRARALVDGTDWSGWSDFETRAIGGFEVTRIPLVGTECLELIAARRDFRFLVADILEPLRRPADVIRAMNIITPVHLPEAALRRAIRNCLEDLKPGGLLILGRSPTDEPNDVAATLFREERGRLQAVRRINGGCEVEGLVAEELRRLRASAGAPAKADR